MTFPSLDDTPYGSVSQRPDFTPADRDDLEPRKPTAYAPQFEGTVFEQALAAMTHAQKAYHRHVDATNADKQRYSPQGYQEQITGFGETGAAKAIEAHVDRVRARRDQAAADVTKVRHALSPDGDTAAELRASRYWNRTKAVLDTQTPSTVLSKGYELISAATPVELGTLLQELEPYCAARGVASTDWIDAAVGQAAPEYGRAVKQLSKAEQALVVIESNAQLLQKSITTGQQVPIPLAQPTHDRYDPDKP